MAADSAVVEAGVFAAFRRLWMVCAVGCAALAAGALYSSAAGGENRQIQTMFTLLALLLAALTAAVAWWLNPARAVRLRRAAPAPAVYALAGAALTAGLGWVMRPDWLYAGVTLATGAVLALGYFTLYAGRPAAGARRRWLLWALAALAAALLLLRVYSLTAYPAVHDIDEGWTLGWALGYMRAGRVTDLLSLGLRPPAGLPLFYAGLSAWLRAAGVGLWQARLFSLALALVMAALTALAARGLYGARAAAFAAAIAASSVVLAHAARIRHDVGLGLALAAALWLHALALKRADLRLHALAGAAVGLGLLAHFHAALFGPALLIGLYGPRLLLAARADRRRVALAAACFGLGGLAAAGLVFAVQIAPDLSQGDAVIIHDVQVTRGDILPLIAAHFANIAVFAPLELLLVVAATGAALWRRTLVDLCLALTLLLAHVLLGFANYTSPYYVIPLTPLYIILLSGLFSQPLPRTPRLAAPGLGSAALAFLMLPLLVAGLPAPAAYLLAGRPIAGETPPTAQWVLDNVPTCATVVGYPYYYLWLTDYRFAYPFLPGVLSAQDSERYPTREALWDAMGVDVFLFNDRLIEPQDLLLPPDYFAARGYRVVAQFPEGRYTTTIYARPELCAGPLTP